MEIRAYKCDKTKCGTILKPNQGFRVPKTFGIFGYKDSFESLDISINNEMVHLCLSCFVSQLPTEVKIEIKNELKAYPLEQPRQQIKTMDIKENAR